MEKPDKRIVEFIRKHHVLTLATVFDNKPWCANCFYSYLENENVLVFTSGNETRHIAEIKANSVVAASIVLETRVVGKIQGLQIEGEVYKPDGEFADTIKYNYLKRFPFAILMDTTLWALKIKYLKFTDNRLGFGKKIIWANEP